MMHLTIVAEQKNCVFVLQINEPIDTLRRLSLFFQDNRVVLNDFNLHRHQNGTALVIAHCLVEKNRFDEIATLLHLLPGVLSMQRMEGK